MTQEQLWWKRRPVVSAEDLAKEVNDAVLRLNQAIETAVAAGLRVDIDREVIVQVGRGHGLPVIMATVARVL